ncbi:unnamed protein product [Oncorhynchus mykiss]|uniref:Anoctamin n=1 Tax=Oncorhynchus mykiss TaxID=8022 RepID=A0A060YLM6_ONCMY|nr:unnamed protein product [Oncorhynchus mykiss]
MLLCFELQEFVMGIKEVPRLARFIPKIMLAITVTACDEVYRKIAYWLNDMENYRLQSAYEKHLIIKLVLFQFVNSYLSLFYIGFYLKDMERLKEVLLVFSLGQSLLRQLKDNVLPFVFLKIKLLVVTIPWVIKASFRSKHLATFGFEQLFYKVCVGKSFAWHVNLSLCPFVILPVLLSFFLSFCPSFCHSVLLPVTLSFFLSLCPSSCHSVLLPVTLSFFLSLCPSSCHSVLLSFFLSFVLLPVTLSFFLSLCPSSCHSVLLPVTLSFFLSLCSSSCHSVLLPVTLSFFLSLCSSSCHSVLLPVTQSISNNCGLVLFISVFLKTQNVPGYVFIPHFLFVLRNILIICCHRCKLMTED